MALFRNVAVIGAGPAGLVTVKTLLQEGHHVTCYDMSHVIGGLWNYEAFKTDCGYQEVTSYDQPIHGIYKSLLQNTSKDISAFSDFPIENGKNEFINHWEYREYLGKYAQHFKLHDHIQLETKVTNLVKGKSGWTVHAENKAKGKFEQDFEFVLIASGTFKYPSVPDFKGIKDNYKGVVLHTTQVRDEDIFKDKRLLVIGGGYSGCEVAAGAIHSKVGKLYFCITNAPDKRNHWIVPRNIEGLKGDIVPWDLAITRYEYFEHPDLFGVRMRSWLHLLHSKDGKEELRFPGDRLALTDIDTFSAGMKSKKVEVVGPIDYFEAKDVILKDGTRLKDIDFVVMGTGFRQKYPFVDSIWQPQEQMKCELYKYVLLPEPRMDGLGFVLSCASPLALFGIMEMQARWLSQKLVTRHYDQNGGLFTEAEREEMREHIKATRKAQPEDLPYNYLVDNPGYVDKLANEIGCQAPADADLEHMGEEGKLLSVLVRYGSWLPCHYRLQGPGKWDGAKDVIVRVGKRILGEEKIKQLLKQ